MISSAIESAGFQALVRCLHWLSSSNISTGQNTLVGVDCAPQCVRVSYGGQKWSFSEEACHPILTAMEQSFSYGCIIGQKVKLGKSKRIFFSFFSFMSFHLLFAFEAEPHQVTLELAMQIMLFLNSQKSVSRVLGLKAYTTMSGESTCLLFFQNLLSGLCRSLICILVVKLISKMAIRANPH